MLKSDEDEQLDTLKILTLLNGKESLKYIRKSVNGLFKGIFLIIFLIWHSGWSKCYISVLPFPRYPNIFSTNFLLTIYNPEPSYLYQNVSNLVNGKQQTVWEDEHGTSCSEMLTYGVQFVHNIKMFFCSQQPL